MQSLKWEGIGMKNLFPHTSSTQWRFRAGAAANRDYAAKFSRTLDTLWSIDSQKKITNFTSPDVRFYGENA